MTQLDALNQTILAVRVQAWNARPGPRIGDKIIMLDGSIRRLAHDTGDDLQTTSKSAPTDQRYYLGHGYCSFSGTLGELIPKNTIEDTGQIDHAPIWFFSHDQARAFNGVHATIPCRLYRQSRLPS